MAEAVVVRHAHAKLNAFLRVTGRREDGYHDLESLVLPLSLADTVTVRMADALRVDVRGPEQLTDAVAAGGMNLALVAALALGDACGGQGAQVQIEKRIPVAAGLGGGSADAAATLLALNELWACMYATSFGRSPTPFEPGRGSTCNVLSTPPACPEAVRNPLPESPGIPGVTV